MSIKQNYKLGLIAMAGLLAAACGDATPDGSATTEGTISVQVTASVDGTLLGDGGITASQTITIDGTTTDKFLVAEFSYSWNGAEFKPIDVSESSRDFEFDLILKKDKNTLVLRAVDTTEISENTSFEVAYYQDLEPPTITAPTAETASLVFSEESMVAEVNPINLVLSGGIGFPVMNNVSYSKYSTTHGVSDGNLPVWRFGVEDNYNTSDADGLEFRVVREEGEVVVGWTTGSSSEEADFEVVISADLNPVLALDSGLFLLEVRAVDAAGNRSEVISMSWEQTILNPLLHIEAATEDDMVSGGATDPASYVLDQNMSDILLQDISVGAMRIGNPNDIAVEAQMNSTLDARATYSYHRGLDGINLDVQAPFNPFNACDNNDTVRLGQGYGCLGINYVPDLNMVKQVTRRVDLSNCKRQLRSGEI